MLVNLDNEVHFKNVFTDVEVFCAFAKDVLGIDLNIKKVETEKMLPSRVSAIKFRMDLFAEDKEKRIIVEIQKVDYDYSYDRFAHYFLGNLIDMQRSSKDYSFEKEVYIIVVVTAAYRISELNGKPVKDDVLLADINPRNLKGDIRNMTKHKMVILNTTYVDDETPQEIKDWMDLILESMNNPHNPKINVEKPGIAKAASLAELNLLTPEQLAESKIQEMRKRTVALVADMARKEVEVKLKETEKKRKEAENKRKEAERKRKEAERKRREAERKRREAERKRREAEEKMKKTLLRALARGKLTKAEIAEDFGVTLEYLNRLEKLRDD